MLRLALVSFAFLSVGLLARPVRGDDCVPFPKLPAEFASELSLDLKKSRIEFLPVDLAAVPGSAERPGYVLSDRDGCSWFGDCDSLVYVGDSKGCYREVLSFHGKWKGTEPAKGRELAFLSVESRIETPSDGKRPYHVERRIRRFEYSASARRYREAK